MVVSMLMFLFACGIPIFLFIIAIAIYMPGEYERIKKVLKESDLVKMYERIKATEKHEMVIPDNINSRGQLTSTQKQDSKKVDVTIRRNTMDKVLMDREGYANMIKPTSSDDNSDEYDISKMKEEITDFTKIMKKSYDEIKDKINTKIENDYNPISGEEDDDDPIKFL